MKISLLILLSIISVNCIAQKSDSIRYDGSDKMPFGDGFIQLEQHETAYSPGDITIFNYPGDSSQFLKTYVWIQDSIAKAHNCHRPYYDSVNKIWNFPF